MDLSSYIPKNQYRYYYSLLGSEKQKIYIDLMNGYLAQKNSISVRIKNVDDMWDVHRAVCYDIPELFYIKNVKASVNPILHTVQIYPEYRFDEETRKNILNQMEKDSKMFIGRISMLSDSEKVKQIHDYLIRSVEYRDVDAPYSHEAPGILLYGIGVCEGISKAFKYLADRVGIDSIVAIGDSSSEANIGDDVGHAWNIVYVDDCPYHLDITFDYSISTEKVVRYDYYLLSDSQIAVDHTFEKLPVCNSPTEYYKYAGSYVENQKALKHLISKKIQPSYPIVFKMPELSGDKRKIMETVKNTVIESIPVAYTVGRSIYFSYNMPRMIFQVELK